MQRYKKESVVKKLNNENSKKKETIETIENHKEYSSGPDCLK